MRRFLTGFVVAVTTTVVPILAFAGNQEVANDIARGLRESGQLKNYKIGVKCQDGTVWLKGSVQSQEQMNTALKLVFQSPGVTRVVNDLAVESNTATAGPSASDTVLKVADAERTRSQVKQLSPVQRLERAVRGNLSRPAAEPQMSQAERVPSSFQQGDLQQVSAIERPAVPRNTLPRMADARNSNRPLPVAYMQPAGPMPAEAGPGGPGGQGGPMPAYVAGAGGGPAPARYDQPQLPNYAWPSYASYPNYAGLTYPRQYSPTAWPYIGPFYPYPQVPLGWRKVTLEWDDGWWMLDFKDR